MTDTTHAAMPNGIHIGIVASDEGLASILSNVTLANLASLVQEIPDSLRRKSVVRIFARPSDASMIRKSEGLKILQNRIEVELYDYVQLTGLNIHGGHDTAATRQIRIVRDAVTQNAALFFLGPDQIYNKGAFAFLIDSMHQGYRVVIGPSPRIRHDVAYPVLKRRILASSDGTFALESQEQVKLLFRYWHPANDQFCLESDRGFSHKPYVYHRPHSNELFVRFLQGLPLMAWPRDTLNDFNGFDDPNLILHCCRTWRDIYVVEDGFECLPLELVDSPRDGEQRLSDFPRVDLLRQLLDHQVVNDMQLVYGLRTCRIHTGEQDPRHSVRGERKLARAVDPLILLAAVDRRVFAKLGNNVRRLLRLLSIMNTHTLVFLLAPFTSIVFRNKRGTVL